MAESEVAGFLMNGGSGVYSYSNNSAFQRKFFDASKELLTKGIVEKLDIDIVASSNTVRVADLGCATGPNTFLAVKTIIDAVELKLKSAGLSSSSLPEFQVFFNDQASNDFNQLFRTIPQGRQYFAAGVPGSFRGRVFPSASLHFVHSSSAIHFLSRVPKEVLDESSPAWNKGKIHHLNSGQEVVKAYEDQYAKDLESFLKAREEEIVHGGLMTLLIPGRVDGTPHSEAVVNKVLELLGFCLVDMANKGRIKSEEIDTFNIPLYFATFQEVEEVVKQNGSFSIEIMDTVAQEKLTLQAFSSTLRAALGGFVKNHFGEDILDELFGLLLEKFEEYSIYDSQNAINIFILLKRI